MRLDTPIRTERLVLATLDESAADGPYLAWMQDPKVLRFLEARHGRNDSESLKRFIRAANESADRLLLGIHERDGDRHIGNIKLGPIDRPNRRGEIGILIGEESRWGRGYAREAIDALCRYGFANLGLHKLTAGCIADNLASLKAFAAVGFRDEARLRRHFHFEGRWVDGIRVARFADEA